ENWISHETRDDYWRHGSVNEQPGAIDCPVLAIGGWIDRYANTVMNLLADNPKTCWGIVGPWGHHFPDVAEPAPGLDFQGEALRWWDHWLKGVDNGVADEPRLRDWMQDYAAPADRMPTRPGRWIGEATWPSDEITTQRYALDNGRLQTTRPSLRRTQTMVMVPDEPKVGLDAGDTGYFGREGGLPLDQRGDDALSLTFETEPLEAPLEILGHASLTLQIETDQPIATLVVRLNDVAPDGTVARVTYAMRNLALDEQGRGPRAKDQLVTITLPNTAYRFDAGHRLRLALSTAYWPQIWPAPAPAKLAFDPATAWLDLPVRSASARELSISFSPPAARFGPSASASSLIRTLERGGDGGDAVVGWRQPRRATAFEEIDLAFASETEAEHRMPAGDPKRATSRFTYRLSLERQDWSVEVEGTASLTSTSTAFQPEGSIEVKENNKTIFRRAWCKSIRRTVS
ncbi:MAG: CocE/NonD family hydrolase, partial [Alphaproteobacteria bacterium]|nr:CocE/NonD family hydrolase [Alphaproteobacteria bacterium]